MNPKPTTISAIILTKNEEDRIAACLGSVAWANERLVIDNGSTDKTVFIAKNLGATVINENSTDFSYLRKVGCNNAKADWIVYIDADELVPQALKEEILTIIRAFNASVDPHGYFLKRKNYYLGHLWPKPDRMERLFWKASLQGWKGRVHETAIVDGLIGQLEHPLIHNTHRTLAEMVEKTNQWSQIEAKLRFNTHHPKVSWWRLIRVMFTGFFDSFIQQRGWRAGTVGWIESVYQAFSMFITYAKLWEMQQESQKSIRQLADKSQKL